MSLRSVRRLFASAGVIGAALAAFAGSALPVQAVDFGTAGFIGRIINEDGQCLDMRSTAADTQAQVEPCNGRSDQNWVWVGVGGGFYHLQNEASRLCLTIRNDYPGVGGKVVQFGCNTTDNFFQWHLGPLAPLGVEILNRVNGYAMHPALCTTAIGAEIYMNVPNQCAVDYWHGG